MSWPWFMPPSSINRRSSSNMRWRSSCWRSCLLPFISLWNGKMSGQTSTQQTQQSSTQPWAPTQPMLMNFINQLSGVPLGASAGQTGAVNQIAGEASGMPSFAGQGENTVNNLFNSNTNPQQNILSG